MRGTAGGGEHGGERGAQHRGGVVRELPGDGQGGHAAGGVVRVAGEALARVAHRRGQRGGRLPSLADRKGDFASHVPHWRGGLGGIEQAGGEADRVGLRRVVEHRKIGGAVRGADGDQPGHLGGIGRGEGPGGRARRGVSHQDNGRSGAQLLDAADDGADLGDDGGEVAARVGQVRRVPGHRDGDGRQVGQAGIRRGAQVEVRIR